MKNIFIYGAGNYGTEVYKKIKNKFNVLGFLDSDKKKYKKYKFKKKIFSPEVLKKKKFDKIYIASMWSNDIFNELITRKIPKKKIYKYPIARIHKNRNKKKNWEVLFNNLIILFEKNNIHYHLDHSSLLGKIRDNDVYASDIDIAVDYKQLFLIQKTLKNSSKFHKIEYGRIDIKDKKFGKQFLYQLTIDKLIDLQVKKQVGKKYYWIIGSKILYCEAKFFKKIKKINFKKIKLNIPYFYKKYLNNLYGATWKIPKTDWSYEDYNNIYSEVKYLNFKRNFIKK